MKKVSAFLRRSEGRDWPFSSDIAAQANVGVQGNSGSRCRMFQTTRMTRNGPLANRTRRFPNWSKITIRSYARGGVPARFERKWPVLRTAVA